MLKNFEELEGCFDALKNDVSAAKAVVSQMEKMSGEYESGKCQERKNLDSDCSLEDKWCSLEKWVGACARGILYSVEEQLSEVLSQMDRIVSLTEYVVGAMSFDFNQIRDNAIQLTDQAVHIRTIIQKNETFLRLVDEAIQSAMIIFWDDLSKGGSCWDEHSESRLETLKTVWDAQDLSLDNAVLRLGEIVSEMGNIMSYIDTVNTSYIYGAFDPKSQISKIQ